MYKRQGYTRAKFGFDADTCAVISNIDGQSPDIALGLSLIHIFGAKQTGFVKLSELTDDSSAKVEDLVKVGDELDLIVEKAVSYTHLDVYKRQSQGLSSAFL